MPPRLRQRHTTTTANVKNKQNNKVMKPNNNNNNDNVTDDSGDIKDNELNNHVHTKHITGETEYEFEQNDIHDETNKQTTKETQSIPQKQISRTLSTPVTTYLY